MIVYKKQKRAENLMNSARFCFFTLLAVAFLFLLGNRFSCFFLAVAFFISSWQPLFLFLLSSRFFIFSWQPLFLFLLSSRFFYFLLATAFLTFFLATGFLAGAFLAAPAFSVFSALGSSFLTFTSSTVKMRVENGLMVPPAARSP